MWNRYISETMISSLTVTDLKLCEIFKSLRNNGFQMGRLWDLFNSVRTLKILQMFRYNRLPLSRTRLSRITAYLEVKILSLPKHENLTSKKYCGKEVLFHTIFDIANVKSQITYIFVKCGCLNYFFLNSENLICRRTNTSKCFRESLGIRDDESRL